MSIHYRQYTDTFSILNYLQNHCLWRKKRSKVGPILSRKFQITYKVIVCGEKGQNWYYSIQKIIKRSILASQVQCLLQKRTWVPGAFVPFSIRVTSCRYELAAIFVFVCRLCIDIAMSNRHVVSFREYCDNRYFRQLITALLWRATCNIIY